MSRSQNTNWSRRNEAVATDTVFSDTPAVDFGVTMAQVFVGTMQSSKQFVSTLKITSDLGELWASSSVIMPKLRFPMKSRISLERTTVVPGILNQIRTPLNGDTIPLRPGLTFSLINLVHLLTAGCSV